MMARRSKYISGFGSHLVLMSTLAYHIKKDVVDVVEFGCGVFSTPFWLNKTMWPKVKFVASYENNFEWARRVGYIARDKRFTQVDEFPSIDGADLIFIDNGPGHEGRLEAIRYVAEQNPVGLVILHDAEEAKYWQAISPHFEHTIMYRGVHPQTALLWNGELYGKYDKDAVLGWLKGIEVYE